MGRVQGTFVATVLAAGAAACAPMQPMPPPMPEQQCVAEPARWAIGREATAEVVEQVRIDTGSRVARVLHPDQVITMEYSFERVNVKVNERNAIIGITCG